MKERRKTKQNSWKKKKTALTSTWKNLPLEATKNSKKLKKKTIQEKKKELKVTNINQSLSTTRKVDRKLCKNLKIEKQHQLGFGEPNWINSLTSGTT